MKYRLSHHAQLELGYRQIPLTMVEDVMDNPEQVLPERDGLTVYQSRVQFPSGQKFLLRVSVDVRVVPAVVVTVYRTTKIGKYWRLA